MKTNSQNKLFKKSLKSVKKKRIVDDFKIAQDLSIYHNPSKKPRQNLEQKLEDEIPT